MIERTRPFFHNAARGMELRGTWLARKKPHVMRCPASVGSDYWVAVFRGKASFHRNPSIAVWKVINAVVVIDRAKGTPYQPPPVRNWRFTCKGDGIVYDKT